MFTKSGKGRFCPKFCGLFRYSCKKISLHKIETNVCELTSCLFSKKVIINLALPFSRKIKKKLPFWLIHELNVQRKKPGNSKRQGVYEFEDSEQRAKCVEKVLENFPLVQRYLDTFWCMAVAFSFQENSPKIGRKTPLYVAVFFKTKVGLRVTLRGEERLKLLLRKKFCLPCGQRRDSCLETNSL